jgi:hypothetical protein
LHFHYSLEFNSEFKQTAKKDHKKREPKPLVADGWNSQLLFDQPVAGRMGMLRTVVPGGIDQTESLGWVDG